MAQTAIIHTPTRVVRRLTTDNVPAVAADETGVVMAVPVDMAGGPWKLDVGNNLVAASVAEAQAAGMDRAFTQAQASLRLTNLLAHLDLMIADATLPARVRTFATLLKTFLTGI